LPAAYCAEGWGRQTRGCDCEKPCKKPFTLPRESTASSRRKWNTRNLNITKKKCSKTCIFSTFTCNLLLL
jgi:hypothetical protein